MEDSPDNECKHFSVGRNRKTVDTKQRFLVRAEAGTWGREVNLKD